MARPMPSRSDFFPRSMTSNGISLYLVLIANSATCFVTSATFGNVSEQAEPDAARVGSGLTIKPAALAATDRFKKSRRLMAHATTRKAQGILTGILAGEAG